MYLKLCEKIWLEVLLFWIIGIWYFLEMVELVSVKLFVKGFSSRLILFCVISCVYWCMLRFMLDWLL